jgi:predicted enzyme related to lactoylglutathione lyase
MGDFMTEAKLNLNSLLIFSEDPKNLAGFYQKVLGKKPDWDHESYVGFMAGNTAITFGQHDKVNGMNKNPERIMLNFETKDVRKEFERIKKLGAKVIAEPYQMEMEGSGWIATFADPDGNIFQLMTPWEDGK